MNILKELLPRVYLISLKKNHDQRGDFLKTYNLDLFKKLKLNFIPQESYLSNSYLNVLRGMHYQVGRFSHDKVVTCFKGKVLDVVVDIRIDSPNYNKPISIVLNEENSYALFIGEGYAHGFLSLSENSIMQYMTSKVYSPKFDCGLLWSSINFNWPTENPILSHRDKLHPSLGNHKCEFF